jgi:hypothetical protein
MPGRPPLLGADLQEDDHHQQEVLHEEALTTLVTFGYP